MAEFAAAMPVRLLIESHGGPAQARNRGARAARADLLAFTDDDCRPRPDWLAALLDRAQSDPGALLGGRVINAFPENPYSTASHLVLEYLSHAGRQDAGEPAFFPTCNLAVPRNQFLALGGFDTSFPFAAGEDRDFCDRWWQAGCPARDAPDAAVVHAHHLTPRGFWRQHLTYGRGAYQLRQRRSARRTAAGPGAGLSFYAGLLATPLRQPGIQNRPAVLGLLLIAQAATLAGLAREAWTTGRNGPARLTTRRIRP